MVCLATPASGNSEVPDFILSLKKIRASDRKALVKRPPKRWKITSKPLIDRRGGELQDHSDNGASKKKGRRRRIKKQKRKN